MEKPIVLVVDDDVSVSQVIEQVLEEDFQVLSVLAADGLEAIEDAWMLRASLIILDLGLPQLGGLEVLKALKARPSTASIPVLVVTGRRDGCREASAAGADSCLAKPFTIEQLVAALTPYLLKQRAVG